MDLLRAAPLLTVFLLASPAQGTRQSANELEHYFTPDTVSTNVTEHGCQAHRNRVEKLTQDHPIRQVSRWDGQDPTGVTAAAHFASVICPEGAVWSTTGFPRAAVSIYVWDGEVAEIPLLTECRVRVMVDISCGRSPCKERRSASPPASSGFRPAHTLLS